MIEGVGVVLIIEGVGVALMTGGVGVVREIRGAAQSMTYTKEANTVHAAATAKEGLTQEFAHAAAEHKEEGVIQEIARAEEGVTQERTGDGVAQNATLLREDVRGEKKAGTRAVACE